MTVAVGRFGPYVRHAGKFYSLPKDVDPLSCTADEAIKIIEEKRQSEEKSLLKTFTKIPNYRSALGASAPTSSTRVTTISSPRAKTLQG